MKKLTSRKFWIAVSSILSGVLMLFGLADTTIETVAAAVLIIGPSLGYMVLEYRLDAKSMNTAIDSVFDIINALKNDEEFKALIERFRK